MTSASVIIPVYNAAATIERTLTSLDRIATKHRCGFQVLVIDDGSTDSSAHIIAETQRRLSGFTWINIAQENQGLSSARNRGMAAADGEWIWFLDADDELQLDLAGELTAASDFSSIAYAVEYSKGGRRVNRVPPRFVARRDYLDVLSAMNPFQPSALVFRRGAITHLFDTSINVVNDWLFWIENAALFDSMLVRADRCIARIHIHGANMSRAYAVAGCNRSEVARRMLTSSDIKLTRLQRNNFFIQQQIGLMQQRRPFSSRTFLSLPCDASLYAKALVYGAAWIFKLRATAYR